MHWKRAHVGLMPACGQVISAAGAIHILGSFPILTTIDHTLSVSSPSSHSTFTFCVRLRASESLGTSTDATTTFGAVPLGG